MCYRVDEPFLSGIELRVAYDDPQLAIPWPLAHPIISAADRANPTLAEVLPTLDETLAPYRT